MDPDSRNEVQDWVYNQHGLGAIVTTLLSSETPSPEVFREGLGVESHNQEHITQK